MLENNVMDLRWSAGVQEGWAGSGLRHDGESVFKIFPAFSVTEAPREGLYRSLQIETGNEGTADRNVNTGKVTTEEGV